jgi:hypothetical protein
MSDIHPPDVANIPEHKASDGLQERGQGAGRLLGEGAEQTIAGDEVEPDEQDAEDLPDGSGSSDHQADES